MSDGGELRRLRVIALRLLASRDHGRHELYQKLRAKGYNPPAVDAVIDELCQQRLLDDLRYAEHFVAAQRGKGRGPLRIRQALLQRGIDKAVVQEAVGGGAWFDEMTALRRKRFGVELPQDARERARQGRFLQYRGYTLEQIRRLFSDIDE